MAAATSMIDGAADEEELCRVLQGHVRTLEQREMSQMRQGAILQRKLDGVEQQLRELRQQQESDQQEAGRAQREKQQAQTTENDQRIKEAARVLEQELQQSLENSHRDAKDAEKSLRAANVRRGQLQSDLKFWRRCAQELLQEESREQTSAKDAEHAAARVRELREQAGTLSSDVEALRRSCAGFENQISDVDKIADAARIEELQIQQRNQVRKASIADMEVEASKARERAAADFQREQAACSQTDSFEQQLRCEQEAARQQETNSSIEEAAYFRRKIQEREKEATSLQQEQGRLHAALQRHAGPAIQQREEPGLDSDFSGTCGPFDETVSRIVTLLFKSIFVRRLFCGHLLVLYSWLFFLLWWMRGSASSHR